jgi:hypothetical protein
MPYDGQFDPEVQDIAESLDVPYEEADDIRNDVVEEPGPSERARQEVNEKTVEKIVGN